MKNENKSLNIKTVRGICIIISFAAILVLLIQNISFVLNTIGKVFSFFSPIILGFCIAFIINALLGPAEKLWEKTFKKSKRKITKKLKRPVCLTLCILVLFGIIFAVIFMLVPQLAKSARMIAVLMPEYIDRIDVFWDGIIRFFAKFDITIPALNFDYEKIGNFVNGMLSTYGDQFINKTVDITTSIIKAVTTLVVAFVFSIYILAQKETLGRQARKLIYSAMSVEKGDKIINFASFVNTTFTKFITGQVLEATILGTLCFIGMLIFGFPYAGVISVLLGFAALIPIFGAIFGTAIGAFLILLIKPVMALWFIVFIILLQWVDGNFIYPKVMGKSIGLPGIWVLAAVTVGSRMWGIPGMLIGVPLTSVIYCSLREFSTKKKIKE